MHFFCSLQIKQYNLCINFLRQLGEYSRNLAQKLQELQQELEINRGNNTPRPDWDRCSAIVDPERWKELSNNKSSIQLLDALLFEIEASKGNHTKPAAGSITIETFTGYVIIIYASESRDCFRRLFE